MLYKIIKIFFGPSVKFLWLGKIKGLENVPQKKSFIVCSNHSSYLDFFLLSAVIPRKVSFLAAEVFFNSKLWWPLVKSTGQIKVDRKVKDKSQVYKEVDNLFEKGGVLGIFPEGTRSRSGKMGKGHIGAVKFAYKYKVPIVPIGITGAYNALPQHKKFPKFKKIDMNIDTEFYVDTDDYEKETVKLMGIIFKLIEHKHE
ncbi:1-acyl-sn-glycerol-3-phosphate acyltransferase [Candidatus Parcubacteria bacterium]|nr:1-acyl-sn-glycerol-3-phosphate acyltransferase [Candidatus Parcubacteria bacterium]